MLTPKIVQLTEELWGIIRRHEAENGVQVYHVIAALEALKFEILRDAFDEAGEAGKEAGGE